MYFFNPNAFLYRQVIFLMRCLAYFYTSINHEGSSKNIHLKKYLFTDTPIGQVAKEPHIIDYNWLLYSTASSVTFSLTHYGKLERGIKSIYLHTIRIAITIFREVI
jgi:hypothetical protein